MFGNIEAEALVSADTTEVFDLADVEARVEEARALIEQAQALVGVIWTGVPRVSRRRHS